METNVNNEIISQLAVKSANLEVQVATLGAENKVLYAQLQQAQAENTEQSKIEEGAELDECSKKTT